MRINHSSGAPWEPLIGYSRAVRAGNMVFVSGSAAVGPDGSIVGGADAYAQMVQCIEVARTALHALGCDIENVVRTRIFVTDINQWEAIGRAHKEFFSMVAPATSMVEVTRLIHPDMLVEIEVDAVIE
jgi:enamine deaminase RidA (YjgF/YER057c/UK114 family)